MLWEIYSARRFCIHGGMSMFRLLLVLGLLWLGGAQLRAEERAETVLEQAFAVLAGVPHLEVKIDLREVQVLSQGAGDAGSSGLRQLWASYQQVRVTRRLPEDWCLTSVRERESGGRRTLERRLAFGLRSDGQGVFWTVNSTTQEPVRIDLPAGLFRQEVLERAGQGLRRDPVLAAMLFNRAESGARAFGINEVTGEAMEVGENGARLRVESPIDPMTRLILWIDPARGLIERALFAPHARPGMPMQRLTEVVYHYDFTRGAADAELDAGAAMAALPTGELVERAEFWSLDKLVAASGVQLGSPLPESGRRSPETGGVARAWPATPAAPPAPPPATPAAPTPEAPPVVAPAPAPAVAVEVQLLTPEQMEAIVVIEGSDGAGSGFLARIRDVDFVVTNLHVVGGNESIQVKTLRGTPIKVSAMFGAVGRDIALLRVEGGHSGPTLRIAEDPVQTAKLGDKVVVVGNRRGGGVATQVSGVVRGIGPDRIEVDAPFQPGNSGSPIVHVATGEVLGLATYSQTRSLDMLDPPSSDTTRARASQSEPAVEQRWFGYRADGVPRWEAIDLAKWRAQARRIADFEADSEAIYHAMSGRFGLASRNPRVRLLISRFEERTNRGGNSQALVVQEVHELFRGLRALADTGTRELRHGEFYDYFRTSLYWETSIPEQLKAREELARRLDRASENASGFLARLRR